jgi:hypothetical protein
MADRVVLLHDRRVLVDARLDQLRERYTVATIGGNGSVDPAAVAGLDGCVRARRRDSLIHAVFTGDSGDVEGEIRRATGVAEVACRHVPLEELFVELLGGER